MGYSRERIEELETEVRKLKRAVTLITNALDNAIVCWPSLEDGILIKRGLKAAEKYRV